MSRDVVIRRQGKDFVLPVNNEIVVDQRSDPPTVRLRHAGGRGGSGYRLEGVLQTADEAIYELGDKLGQDEAGPYRPPLIQEEMARLRERFAQAGGDLTKFSAWAPGESHSEHMTRQRAMIRAIEAGQEI